MVCLYMSSVDTEYFTTVLQIGIIISGCAGLRFGSRRSGVSPGSKCRVLLRIIAVSGAIHSRILKPVGAKPSIVNMGTTMNMSGWRSIWLFDNDLVC